MLDLSTPRRTPPKAIFFPLLESGRKAWTAIIPLVALPRAAFGLVVVLLLVLGVTFSVLAWHRRRWSFDGAMLAVDEGVLTVRERRIPVERIQQIEIERKLRHLVTGLVVARVETAGGNQSQFDLDGLTVDEAEQLRRQALAAVAPTIAADTDPAAMPPPVVERRLITLTPARLMLAGVTGPELLAFPAAVIGLLQLGGDGFADSVADQGPERLFLGVSIGIVLTVAGGALTSLVRSWDLRVDVLGRDLRMRYGLVRQTEVSFTAERVLSVTVHQTFARRLIRRFDVVARTAGRGASGDRSQLAVPLLTAAEVELLRRELIGDVSIPELRPAPPRARRRSIVRVALGTAPLTVAAALGAGSLWGARVGIATGIVMVSLAIPGGILRHRALGFAASDEIVVSRWGVVIRRWDHVLASRVQSVAHSSSPFQRRLRLASVRVAHARGALHAIDRDPETELPTFRTLTAPT